MNVYILNQAEKTRLSEGIQAVWAIPFIDDIEDFIWEVVFSYVKDIPLVDTLNNIRSKMLFDVVDRINNIGWSAKSHQHTIRSGCDFEVVIQRADIFKKRALLGFEQLSINSDEQELGDAIWQHWYATKVRHDALAQNVNDMRICILLKSKDRRQYAYFEDDIAFYARENIAWRWTDSTKTGLQGIRKTDGFCVFRWYSNQKQLFERFVLPGDAYMFNLQPKRLPLPEVVQNLLAALHKP